MLWTGRQLSTLTKNGSTFSYKYDVDGLRLEKTANGITTEYQYVNGQLLGEKRSNGVILRYTYDPFGALSSIQYKNAGGTTTNYIVRCTLSGDVDQIFNTSGNLVARYIYDTWGNTVSVTDASGNAITSSTHIANINPIRYRGYYWDKETGFYYLQSRYYDTVTQRYVNADGYVFTGQDMQSGNMFAYCGNNPVTRSDSSGGMYVVEEGDRFLTNERAQAEIRKWRQYYREQNGFSENSNSGLNYLFGASYSVKSEYRPPKQEMFSLGISFTSGSGTTYTYETVGDSSKAFSVYAVGRVDNLFLSSAGLKLNMLDGSLSLNLGLDDISLTTAIASGNQTSSAAIKVDLYHYKVGLEARQTTCWSEAHSDYVYANLSVDILSLIALAKFIETGDPGSLSPNFAPVY